MKDKETLLGELWGGEIDPPKRGQGSELLEVLIDIRDVLIGLDYNLNKMWGHK